MTSRINPFLLGCIAAMLLAWAMLSAGCATMPDRCVQTRGPVTIVVHESDERGSCQPALSWITVRWDGDHPDYYALGRELWVVAQGGCDGTFCRGQPR